MQYDCERCGACCTNPNENRAEGFVAYVDVAKDSPLRKDKRLVVINEDGGAHMRLDPAGRCVALRGRLGERVTCVVYKDRPRGCRLVEAGSERCILARRERGLQSS